MAIYTAKDLIRLFTDRYSPDDQLVITWWDKTDVEVYADEVGKPVEDLWESVLDEADEALENQIGVVNDHIQYRIYREEN